MNPNLLQKSFGHFGAVRLRGGKLFFRREKNKFNTLTCWQFIISDAISRCLLTGPPFP